MVIAVPIAAMLMSAFGIKRRPTTQSTQIRDSCHWVFPLQNPMIVDATWQVDRRKQPNIACEEV